VILWSMLRKRTFLHFRWANTANRQSSPHVDIIKPIEARAPCRQKGSEHWEHCAAYDSKQKLSAEKRQEPQLFSNEEKEKLIEDYVERETAVARYQVQDAETVIMQELKDMTTAENAVATTRKPDTMFEEMLNAIRDSLSDLASSNDEQSREDMEDDEEDTELGKLRDDDETGWVMGTIFKTVQRRMERFRPKQMRLDQLTKLGWGDTANYFRERDMKYGSAT